MSRGTARTNHSLGRTGQMPARETSETPIGSISLKILSIRPGPPGSSTLARFDLELNDHLRLYNRALRQRGEEPVHVMAPNAFQERTAGFSASFNKALAELAFNSLVELQTDATRHV